MPDGAPTAAGPAAQDGSATPTEEAAASAAAAALPLPPQLAGRDRRALRAAAMRAKGEGTMATLSLAGDGETPPPKPSFIQEVASIVVRRDPSRHALVPPVSARAARRTAAWETSPRLPSRRGARAFPRRSRAVVATSPSALTAFRRGVCAWRVVSSGSRRARPVAATRSPSSLSPRFRDDLADGVAAARGAASRARARRRAHAGRQVEARCEARRGARARPARRRGRRARAGARPHRPPLPAAPDGAEARARARARCRGQRGVVASRRAHHTSGRWGVPRVSCCVHAPRRVFSLASTGTLAVVLLKHGQRITQRNTRQARSAVGRFRIAVAVRSNRGINPRSTSLDPTPAKGAV